MTTATSNLGTAGPRLSVGAALIAVVLILAPGAVASAHADPDQGGAPAVPYPELRYFTRIDGEPYRTPDGGGLWFVAAENLNCGIWDGGNFGCGGDIPGAPPAVHQLGWITGDTRVHYDWTLAVRFPKPRGMLRIPPLTFIESEGTSCGTTVDGDTYCERGPWRFLITPTHTWLNG